MAGQGIQLVARRPDGAGVGQGRRRRRGVDGPLERGSMLQRRAAPSANNSSTVTGVSNGLVASPSSTAWRKAAFGRQLPGVTIATPRALAGRSPWIMARSASSWWAASTWSPPLDEVAGQPGIGRDRGHLPIALALQGERLGQRGVAQISRERREQIVVDDQMVDAPVDQPVEGAAIERAALHPGPRIRAEVQGGRQRVAGPAQLGGQLGVEAGADHRRQIERDVGLVHHLGVRPGWPPGPASTPRPGWPARRRPAHPGLGGGAAG